MHESESEEWLKLVGGKKEDMDMLTETQCCGGSKLQNSGFLQ